MRHWLGASRDELAAFVAGAGQPAYRAKQVWDWLHGKRIADFPEMRNLPRELRESMAAAGFFEVASWRDESSIERVSGGRNPY